MVSIRSGVPAVVLSTALLVGCTTAPPGPDPTSGGEPTRTATVSPAPIEEELTADGAPFEEARELHDRADYPLAPDDAELDHVHYFLVRVPTDSGPREYAQGTAVLDAEGVPIAYEVAPGEILDYVEERFGLPPIYLVVLNQVRRGYTGMLYAGDTINLDAQTILTVGDINGEVLAEPAPDPLPPQR